MLKTCYHLPATMTSQHRKCMPLDNTLLVSKKHIQQQRRLPHAIRSCTALRPTTWQLVLIQTLMHI